MPPATPTISVSPFKAILDWSKGWTAWQQDALRRIVVNGDLTKTDIGELEALCKIKHGIVPASSATPVVAPLAASHLPGGPDATSSISLVRLANLKTVNRLPSDQAMTFGDATGLTIIYGENGAGKSGYARVIKKACRARGLPPDIKADAYSPVTTTKATANIVFRVGTVETPISWTDGTAADPRLGNIFVFDARSAQVYVSEDGPACFVPRGLDVLPKLAKACDDIKKNLQDLIDAEFKVIQSSRTAWKLKPGTVVAKLLTDLSAQTKPDVIETNATFAATDEIRLKDLTAALKEDPKTKSAQTTQMAKRIRDFATDLQNRETALVDTETAKVKTALEEAAAAQLAAKAAAGPKVDISDLPGTYGEAWRKLWDIAREFAATDAYKGDAFPSANADTRCVLCQRTLDDDARARFTRFDEYVRDETRSRARKATEAVAALVTKFSLLAPLKTKHDTISADMTAAAKDKASAIEAGVTALDSRLAHVQRCLKDFAWTEIKAPPASTIADLRSIGDMLDQRAAMELSAHDAIKRAALEAERNELESKEWLSKNKADVLDALKRYKTTDTLKKCQGDTVTNTITNKSGELQDAVVTTAFCKAFATELKELRVESLPVELEAVSRDKGKRVFGLRLANATKKPNGDPLFGVIDVASEGEHRSIALAAFLAELSQSSHRSALVFDDPVSSLDHKRRDAIAARLAKEAKLRQVIVFTHDLAFVCDLETAAGDGEVSCFHQHLDRHAGIPGKVIEGLPWDGESSKQQMKTLRELVGKANKVRTNGSDTDYREAAMPVIGKLRGACERVIEETLLNGVVRRHDSRIKVGYLESVAIVTAEQFKAVYVIWRDCSNVIEAHAKPRSGPVNVPEPKVLDKWVGDLETLIEAVRIARKRVAVSPAPIVPAKAPEMA
jgi:hypothetical protein